MEELFLILQKYQSKLEATNLNPYGTCYLAGPCIAEYLRTIGISARDVTGSLTLRDKHGKEIIYGKSKPSSRNIGMYHTWCEASLDGTNYLLDASLKYNKVYLKKYLGTKIKIANQVPDILVTEKRKTYWWNYKEDKSLISVSQSYLRTCSSHLVHYLSQLE
ncbi:hypothetical protein [Salinimicrobium xinjiangense]|uniref:hypothetical protein n=1 Tax=Salinimicrobium xinjiangense TaxID=438596 RepID=UPI000491B349|nr:hypothetical protein [Salinimicrobium xinjiangense]